MEYLKIGDKSPWGKIDFIEQVCSFLNRVHTSGHGGFKVEKSYNKLIPSSLRKKNGWYEEDCEWCIPLFFLEKEIMDDLYISQKETIQKIYYEKLPSKEIKNWYWKEFEDLFSIIIPLSESRQKAQYFRKTEIIDKWVPISSESLENDLIKLHLTKGGEKSTQLKQVEERILVVRKEIYNNWIKKFNRHSPTIALSGLDIIILDVENENLLEKKD